MADPPAESLQPKYKPASPIEGLKLAKSKPASPGSEASTTSSTTSKTTSKTSPTIDTLQAQADRLKLFTDPLSRLMTRRTTNPSSPANTPVSAVTPHDKEEEKETSRPSSFMSDDPFATQRTEDNNPFSLPLIDSPPLDLSRTLGEIGTSAGQRRASQADRKMSKEWDASKVPPSRFQRPEGSIFATQGSRDGHVARNVQHSYMEKLKEKGWDK